ncbi:MAG: hypothetical protein PHD13_05385 [Methanocellales archaeon]|nr:hypothetical protein [Methanocellales archaeon]MDD3292304.1 hypothetical protein [Methanocellales archaeon]MDD5235586.1 hypothetical protein [Methanocellales archaeon]MDD5485767.1 hypothetical protein [Methanocellales archaeon]
MNSEVIEKRLNPLLKRLEITFKVDHEGATPSREEIRNNLAAMLNAKKELVIIERMRSEYGKRETRGYAKIYNSEKDLRDIEQAHIIQRNVIKAEEKPAEKVETKKEVEPELKEKTPKSKEIKAKPEISAEKVETKKEVEPKPKEKTSKSNPKSKEAKAKPETKSKGE